MDSLAFVSFVRLGKRKCLDGGPQPKYIRDGLQIIAEFRAEDATMLEDRDQKQILTAKEAYQILSQISDEDCIILGFNPRFGRPEWMLWTVLPVPPPQGMY